MHLQLVDAAHLSFKVPRTPSQIAMTLAQNLEKTPVDLTTFTTNNAFKSAAHIDTNLPKWKRLLQQNTNPAVIITLSPNITSVKKMAHQLTQNGKIEDVLFLQNGTSTADFAGKITHYSFKGTPYSHDPKVHREVLGALTAEQAKSKKELMASMNRHGVSFGLGPHVPGSAVYKDHQLVDLIHGQNENISIISNLESEVRNGMTLAAEAKGVERSKRNQLVVIPILK